MAERALQGGPRLIEYLSRDIGPCSYYIALCLTEESFLKEMRRMQCPEKQWLPDTSEARVNFLENKTTREQAAIVQLDYERQKHKPRAVIHGYLVHEAVHVWRAHLEHIKERTPGEEIEALGIEYIARNLMACYDNYDEKQKGLTRSRKRR